MTFLYNSGVLSEFEWHGRERISYAHSIFVRLIDDANLFHDDTEKGAQSKARQGKARQAQQNVGASLR